MWSTTGTSSSATTPTCRSPPAATPNNKADENEFVLLNVEALLQAK
jgi:hypothetical protein